MPLRSIAYSIVVLLLALSAAGCRKDLSLPAALEESEAGGIYINIAVSAGTAPVVKSPAPGEDGDGPESGSGPENTVNDLNVYFFEGDSAPEGGERLGLNSVDGDIPVRHLYVGKQQLTLQQAAGTEYDAVYVATEEVSDLLEVGRTYDVVVIANAGEETAISKLSDLRDKVFDKEGLLKYQYDPYLGKKVESIMMASAEPAWFTLDAGNDSPQNAVPVRVELERMVARIDCTVDIIYDVPGTKDKVEMEGIYIVNRYKGETYAFKRVTEDLKTNPVKIEYLGKEKVADNIAANYVLDPKTLAAQPAEQDYDVYFNTYFSGEDWAQQYQKETEKEDNTYTYVSYMLENVMINDAPGVSVNDYSTGIVFAAVYSPDGMSGEGNRSDFYWYNGKAYSSLESIGLPGATEGNYENYGIRFYKGGRCYYTYWINHADDGDDNSIGPMEFAIVRNNVYKINVTGISGIGTPEPSDYGLYLNCNVLDWYPVEDLVVDLRDNYSGTFSPVLYKKAYHGPEEYVITAYSQDNEPREAQFSFKMDTPEGAVWTAHLTNPVDFELIGEYSGVGGGSGVTLTVRPRRAYEEGTVRTTELYITYQVTGGVEKRLDFNQGTQVPGTSNTVRILQVSTAAYDQTSTVGGNN